MAGAISQLSSTLTLTDGDYEKPTVTSDSENLIQARKDAATVLSTDLKFQVKGTTVTELLGTTAAQWVTTDDQGNLALDSSKYQDWCSKMAKEYTTVGSKRTFSRADGEKITVSGGNYGWDVDEDTLATTVHDDVLKGAQETLDLPMTQTADAYNADTGVDWTSYIDVDISEQHATYYDANGKVLWESDVVTGAPGGDTDTSTGVYYINNKESPSTLNGYNLQTGKKKYSTKVKYWMPWDGNVIGFHDATWQSAFGGTRYRDGYGSNGCVNLPLKKAASLYKLVKVGTGGVPQVMPLNCRGTRYGRYGFRREAARTVRPGCAATEERNKECCFPTSVSLRTNSRIRSMPMWAWPTAASPMWARSARRRISAKSTTAAAKCSCPVW